MSSGSNSKALSPSSTGPNSGSFLMVVAEKNKGHGYDLMGVLLLPLCGKFRAEIGRVVLLGTAWVGHNFSVVYLRLRDTSAARV